MQFSVCVVTNLFRFRDNSASNSRQHINVGHKVTAIVAKDLELVHFSFRCFDYYFHSPTHKHSLNIPKSHLSISPTFACARLWRFLSFIFCPKTYLQQILTHWHH